MKKHIKRLVSVFAAAGMTASMAAMSASADYSDADKNYVTLSVEKFSIGQGYVCEPVRVEIFEGDMGMDVIMKAVGEENVFTNDSGYGAYISAFADEDSGSVNLADCVKAVVSEDALTGRTAEGRLSEFDYTAEGGFILFVNNAPSPVGISDYEPQSGDVIRFQYSIYGYGSDIGCDNSSWGGSPSLIGDVNRDKATEAVAFAMESEKNPDISAQMEVIADLDSTQREIDTAEAEILAMLSESEEKPEVEEKPEIEEKPETEDKPADTGLTVTFTACAVAALSMVALKRVKKI